VEHYADIRAHLEKAGKSIGPNDLVIAATARANGHTLITRNTSEFIRVPALAVEVW
jgi:tRNA(fMet)-specific endonuclease VapC